MSYTWNSGDVATFLALFQDADFTGFGATAQVTTTAEFARSVLPPCFEVPDVPQISLSVGLFRERYHGISAHGAGVEQEEEVGSISINAVRNGVEGVYSLSEIVSGDFQVSSGREFWGNPKKRGNARVYVNGDTLYAYVERRGVRIIEIEGRLGALRPDEVGLGERYNYYAIKTDFAANGSGFYSPPRLVTLNNGDDHKHSQEIDDLVVTLRGSEADPLHTIPVVSIDNGRYHMGGGSYEVVSEEELADGDLYLPFLLGRQYDNVISHMAARHGAISLVQ